MNDRAGAPVFNRLSRERRVVVVRRRREEPSRASDVPLLPRPDPLPIADPVHEYLVLASSTTFVAEGVSQRPFLALFRERRKAG